MHSQVIVIVADVVKECCRVVVGLNGFVDLFTVWCQSHHIIAYVVPGHVDVHDVLILLLGWQLEKIFATQRFFFLSAVIVIVAKLALAAVISSKVLIAFARFVVKSMGLIMAFVVFLERLVMTELEGPITNDQFLSCTSVSVSLTWDFLNEYRGLFIFEKRVMFNQEVFTGFKIYYQIVSRQSRCKMVWT